MDPNRNLRSTNLKTLFKTEKKSKQHVHILMMYDENATSACTGPYSATQHMASITTFSMLSLRSYTPDPEIHCLPCVTHTSEPPTENICAWKRRKLRTASRRNRPQESLLPGFCPDVWKVIPLARAIRSGGCCFTYMRNARIDLLNIPF